jgi:hypothetical protein
MFAKIRTVFLLASDFVRIGVAAVLLPLASSPSLSADPAKPAGMAVSVVKAKDNCFK